MLNQISLRNLASLFTLVLVTSCSPHSDSIIVLSGKYQQAIIPEGAASNASSLGRIGIDFLRDNRAAIYGLELDYDSPLELSYEIDIEEEYGLPTITFSGSYLGGEPLVVAESRNSMILVAESESQSIVLKKVTKFDFPDVPQ